MSYFQKCFLKFIIKLNSDCNDYLLDLPKYLLIREEKGDFQNSTQRLLQTLIKLQRKAFLDIVTEFS